MIEYFILNINYLANIIFNVNYLYFNEIFYYKYFIIDIKTLSIIK